MPRCVAVAQPDKLHRASLSRSQSPVFHGELTGLPLKTPVAFIVFNRPEHTAVSFAQIRDQRPAELFLIADGPRPGHAQDPGRCQKVRTVLENIDWPCTVHRDYADANMGCKRRVSSGLDRVFSQVDRAIVLEDDCVPDDVFFSYCEALLDRYRDDDRVAVITGDNFQGGIPRGDGSYYFSKYNHVWGWASWSRAWQRYDGTIGFWPAWEDSPQWRATHPDRTERRYWERILSRVARGEIDTWDYPWMASTWYHGGLTATPNANLVRNIGFGPDATHTKSARNLPGSETAPLGPLRHPSEIQQDVEADRYTFEHCFGGAALRRRRRPLGLMRWLCIRLMRWLGIRRLRPFLPARGEGKGRVGFEAKLLHFWSSR